MKPKRTLSDTFDTGMYSRHKTPQAALQAWRLAMGKVLRRADVGPEGGSKDLTQAEAAAYISTPVRTWERWEAGRSLPPPCLWVALRLLLREVRRHGLHAEDTPANRRSRYVSGEWGQPSDSAPAPGAATDTGTAADPAMPASGPGPLES